jgi:hypothetical protein
MSFIIYKIMITNCYGQISQSSPKYMYIFTFIISWSLFFYIFILPTLSITISIIYKILPFLNMYRNALFTFEESFNTILNELRSPDIHCETQMILFLFGLLFAICLFGMVCFLSYVCLKIIYKIIRLCKKIV